MKYILQSSILLVIVSVFSSCLVNNNLYINDPAPVKKGEGKVYFAAGTGIKPKIDSASAVTNRVYFTNKLASGTLFAVGGQYQATDLLSVRMALHLPYVVGGIGLRAGPQLSFFKGDSKFNAAIGLDLGGLFTRDSMSIFGTRIGTQVPMKGTVNADFFLPIGYKFSNNFTVALTPRYSFNTMFVRKFRDGSSLRPFRFGLPVLTLGVRFYAVYVEASAIRYNNTTFSNVGIALIIPDSKSKNKKVETPK